DAVGARLVLVEWACPGSETPPERRDPDYIEWIDQVLRDAVDAADEQGLAASVLAAGEQTCTGGATGRPSAAQRRFMGDSNHVLGQDEGERLWHDWLGPALVELVGSAPR